MLALVALTTIVGVGLNILLGLAGQISLGHVGFYAIGAYAVGDPDAQGHQLLAGAARWPASLAGGDRRPARLARAARRGALSGDDDDRLRLHRRSTAPSSGAS